MEASHLQVTHLTMASILGLLGWILSRDFGSDSKVEAKLNFLILGLLGWILSRDSGSNATLPLHLLKGPRVPSQLSQPSLRVRHSDLDRSIPNGGHRSYH